ncbi:MAG: tripartite tricarboxylate transporter substrate binding protein [Rhodoplanes sp.]|uniref:Bug family tripartite tricarboxylate transporter substrate binding protein n=1 Tax=Rhodoplanes sp. TaxID=1968906 RepID=UPI0017D780A0|nr:tripartite tricarboxylate transporter substrate binding protein [Rhodoplanes sp.]NVO15346.1 tripartite tricarboxylate transporter substrate binding protein [Rhodoplanes sp.]
MAMMRTAIALILLCMLGTPLAAQVKFPTRPVVMVVPFPPGGGTDTGSRFLAQKLSERWKQTVIVENRPGAAGNIGLEYASKAKPDGYTIMMGNIGTQSINPSLYKNLAYNPDTAFQPIALVAELPLVAVVTPSLNVKTVGELIALAKAQPGDLTYGTSGSGSAMHLAAALFEDGAGVTLTHVPYKGGGPAIQDVIGGHIKMSFATILETSGHLKSNRLRAVAVTSAKRSPAMPDLPTVAETGLPGFDSISWIGLLAPAGTPKDIVDQIAADTKWAIEETDLGEKLIKQGATPLFLGPAAFADLIAKDRTRYGKVIVEKNIVAE